MYNYNKYLFRSICPPATHLLRSESVTLGFPFCWCCLKWEIRFFCLSCWVVCTAKSRATLRNLVCTVVSCPFMVHFVLEQSPLTGLWAPFNMEWNIRVNRRVKNKSMKNNSSVTRRCRKASRLCVLWCLSAFLDRSRNRPPPAAKFVLGLVHKSPSYSALF